MFSTIFFARQLIDLWLFCVYICLGKRGRHNLPWYNRSRDMICREGIRLRCFSLWIDIGFWEKRVNRKRLSDFFRTFLWFMRNMHFGAYFRYHVLYWPTPHRRVSCIWLWCVSIFLISGPFHCLTRFSWRWTCLVRSSLFFIRKLVYKVNKKMNIFFFKVSCV